MTLKAVFKFILPALVLSAAPALADGFPSGPIKIVVPYPPGGLTDTVARLMAKELSAKLNGASLYVENKGGANGNIGAEYVAQSKPDGATLMISAGGPLSFNKNLYPKLNYDPEAFAPISVLIKSYSLMVAKGDSKFNTVKDVVDYAKANPGKLSYASAGIGSTPFLAAELLKSLAGLNITEVPYRGIGPAMNDVISGQVDLMFPEVGGALPLVKGKQLKAIAFGGDARAPALPDTPTVAETLPGFLSITWFAMVAPPKTPDAITGKIWTAISEIEKEPEVLKAFKNFNIEPVGSNPKDTRAFIDGEAHRWNAVLKGANIKIKE